MINFSGQTRCSTCERVYIITIFQYLKRVRSLCYRISWIPTVPQTSVFPSAMAEFFVDFNGLYHKGAKLANTQYFWLPYLKHCLSGCRVSNCQPNSIAAYFSPNIGSSPGFRRDETFTHMFETIPWLKMFITLCLKATFSGSLDSHLRFF